MSSNLLETKNLSIMLHTVKELQMPVCKNCGSAFPNRLLIDGKMRMLSSRKYCLTCSPFKSHNTRVIHKAINEGDGQICKVCGRTYIYTRSAGHRMNKCNTCAVKIRHDRMKARAVEYKGGKCTVCGYDKCIHALCFHHKDSSTKEFTIGGSYNRSWNSIKQELDKCIIVCMNCHVEIHSESAQLDSNQRPPACKAGAHSS